MLAKELFNRFYLFFGIPWLFLVIFTSGSFTAVKVILLALLMVTGFVEMINRKLPVNRNYWGYTWLFVGYSVFSLTLGILNGFEFSMETCFSLIQYFILTPICIFVFTTVFGCSDQRKAALWKVLVYMTAALAILDVMKLVFLMMGMQPFFLSFLEMSSENIKETSLALRISNESSFFFLLPIFVFLLFNTGKGRLRMLYLIITAFGVIYALLSGRKTLELEIVLAVGIAICYKRPIVKIFRIAALCLLCLIVLSPLLFSYLGSLLGIENIGQLFVDTIVNGLSSGAHGVVKRENNSYALIELWLQSPLVGNGLNSYAAESLANYVTKWSYEVFYIAYLAQTGIVGMIILLIPMAYIIRRLYNLSKHHGDAKSFALCLAFICFIIAGATNPLLYFVWPWSIGMIYSYDNQDVRLEYRKSGFLLA